MLYGVFILILILDQLTKHLAIIHLKGREPIVLIKKFLQLNYVENYGAAFGILQNRKALFVAITIIVIISVCLYLIKNFHFLNKLMKVSLVMLMAGAIGNFIDRIRLGYVVDFIDFKFWGQYDFPVFNVADSFIVVSTILIIYMILFNKYEI